MCFRDFVLFQLLPQIANARPMEDLTLAFTLKPGFVAVSFRHVTLQLPFVAVQPHQVLCVCRTDRVDPPQRSRPAPVKEVPSWEPPCQTPARLERSGRADARFGLADDGSSIGNHGRSHVHSTRLAPRRLCTTGHRGGGSRRLQLVDERMNVPRLNFKRLILSAQRGSLQTKLDKQSEVTDSGQARRGLTLGLQVI